MIDFGRKAQLAAGAAIEVVYGLPGVGGLTDEIKVITAGGDG